MIMCYSYNQITEQELDYISVLMFPGTMVDIEF